MEHLLASHLYKFITSSFDKSMYDLNDVLKINKFINYKFITCNTYTEFISNFDIIDTELEESINYIKKELTEDEKIQLATDCFDIIIADAVEDINRENKLVNFLKKLGLSNNLILVLQFDYHHFSRKYRSLSFVDNRESIDEFSHLEKSLMILYYSLMILAIDEESMEINLKLYFHETSLYFKFTADELRLFGSEMLEEAHKKNEDFIADCIEAIKEEHTQDSLMSYAIDFSKTITIAGDASDDQIKLFARIITGFMLSDENKELIYSYHNSKILHT